MKLGGAPRGREIAGDEARDILRAVLDAGISYIDISPDYGHSFVMNVLLLSH